MSWRERFDAYEEGLVRGGMASAFIVLVYYVCLTR